MHSSKKNSQGFSGLRPGGLCKLFLNPKLWTIWAQSISTSEARIEFCHHFVAKPSNTLSPEDTLRGSPMFHANKRKGMTSCNKGIMAFTDSFKNTRVSAENHLYVDKNIPCKYATFFFESFSFWAVGNEKSVVKKNMLASCGQMQSCKPLIGGSVEEQKRKGWRRWCTSQHLASHIVGLSIGHSSSTCEWLDAR